MISAARGPSRCAAAGASALALFLAAASWAGSFMANPIRLVVPAGANATSLTLDNTGGEPVLVQAEVFAWSQNDNKDVLTPTDDLVVSPPIFTIAPGASQIVRVGLVRRPASDREITYRLFLQEVVRPDSTGAPGVNVSLRLSLPVFVSHRGAAVPGFQMRVEPEGDALRLFMVNTGNAHLQLLDCRIATEGGALVAEQTLGAYVLAGATRSWLVKAARPWRGQKLTITAKTPGGSITSDITAP